MDVVIRAAQLEDLSQIREFYQEVTATIDPAVTSWLPGVYPSLKTAEAAIQEETLFLALVSGKIAGSVILNYNFDEEYRAIPWANPLLAPEKILVVHTLMTSPTFRRQGIAQKLLQFAIVLAEKRGCEAIRLDTFAANLPAQHLYQKLGFTLRGTADLPSWNGNGMDSCVFFERVTYSS
ncbi:GNAT family N-acetyltransferase [Enterococcus sp. 669A]|uniref:GNAT family N-acetyltransferase n=1 Tax=Candidatus Enterococcus moelleringii TaxID=2815325 RepID=A0ABS3LIR8_9ENTE|nr:GNAT family N-acetyltransferase [Enterococcus sp. 669A]MBO1308611.1 GNAT family N-acetyltransferase [Enterococcus sp. 669A]